MLKRKWNQNWQVKVSDGVSLNMLREQVKPQDVTLPYDVSIHTERKADDVSGPGNAYFHEDNYVYTTKLPLDARDQGKRVWMEFEGVYQNAYVYVNENYAGKCPYGYSNFYLDITKLMVFGADNDVKVIVKNNGASGRWYTGGGIYRDVNVMICDPIHFAPDSVGLATVDADVELAVIEVKAQIDNQSYANKNLNWTVTLTDAEGNVVADNDHKIMLTENASGEYKLKLYVKKPHLWSAETPYLYSYIAELKDGETVLDVEKGRTGIRKLQLDPVHGLRVNGQTVKLRGGCLHHDFGILGAADFKNAAYDKVRKLKDAGYNAIRSSHYPIGRHMLEACDEIGLYVMDEYTDVWTTSKVAFDYSMHMQEWWEHDLTNMVKKDYNHPSVILYSIGNEIPETGSDMDRAWGKRFNDKIKALDPYRYTVNSINLLLSSMSALKKMAPAGAQGQAESQDNGGSSEINTAMNNLGDMMKMLLVSPMVANIVRESSEQTDVTGYNYAAGRYETEGKDYPNRIICGTETNAPDLDENWALVEKLPYVIGDFAWTAWDYLGETGIGGCSYEDEPSTMYAPYPYKTADCGDINIIGDRLPISYWREIIWGRRIVPYIAVQPPMHYGKKKNLSQWAMTDAIRSWNWSGYEDKNIVVEVYANADEVELFVNGRSLGRKTCGEEKQAVTKFDMVYVPGKIEAVAYKDGKEIGRDEIVSASKDLRFDVKVADPVIPADGGDVSLLDVTICDVSGNCNPETDLTVTIEVEGAGYVAGYGSGSPKNEENFFDTKIKAYEGRLRAAIRAKEMGTIRVTFAADGLESKTVEITAE